MRTRVLERSLWLPLPLDQVFPFFGTASNLNDLTPPWVHFQILTPEPIVMAVGTRIEYRLRLHGVPIRWETEITVWEPPHRFVDVQLRGPYRRWEHEHRFSPKEGGTLVEDHVTYQVPGGWFEPILVRWLVAPDLERLFAYRRTRVLEHFCVSDSMPQPDGRGRI